MARFRAVITGSKSGEVSRLDHAKNGMVVEANGWKLGVRVRAYVDEEGRDCFDVYQTRGSGSWGDDGLLASIKGEVQNG